MTEINIEKIKEQVAEEFGAMADYMDAFPDCTLFSDGGGKPCR